MCFIIFIVTPCMLSSYSIQLMILLASCITYTTFSLYIQHWYVIRVLLTACEQDQDGTAFHLHPASKLLDINQFCTYSEKLLMMDRGTVRNM